MNPIFLIVEDHAALRKTLHEWLQAEFLDGTILEAGSGEEAIERTRQIPPDIVLMDISLPGMNGIETVRYLKLIHPAAKVVILTIHNDMAYRASAVIVGANAYVSKERMYTELLPTLKVLLRGPPDVPPSSEGNNGEPRTALLIEDEPLILLTNEYMLQSFGFVCTSCLTAMSALEACQQRAYTVIVSDLGLPDMWGTDLLRQIRALPNGKWSVIVVLTANYDKQQIQAAVEAGADGFLKKPVDPAMLKEQVMTLLHQFQHRNKEA